MFRFLFVCALLLLTASADAAELRFSGVLGNSGYGDGILVTFSGVAAAGMGPVLDEAKTLW